jgi:hypothetical protein
MLFSPLPEHLLRLLQLAAQETWHFIEHITGQRIDGRELRVEVEGDLDLLLNGWEQRERAHDPLGLSPARGVRGVRERTLANPAPSPSQIARSFSVNSEVKT